MLPLHRTYGSCIGMIAGLTRRSSACHDGQSVAGAGRGSPGRRHKPVGRPANVCSPAASHAGA
eukprot:scaffold331115_cov18-Prasinocladus_malaysianus.AAC.1